MQTIRDMGKEILYDPLKSLREMGAEAGVTERIVRSFLEKNKLDYSADRHNALRRIARDGLCKARKRGVDEFDLYTTVAEEMSKRFGKMSAALVEYLCQSDERPRRKYWGESGEVDVMQMPGSSVRDSDESVLKDILRLYLPKNKTFDCDLTYGMGGFYKHMPDPKYCYDECVFIKDFVEPLADLDLKPGSLRSVVIDLPAEVDEKADKEEAFESIEEMYETYIDMIDKGARLLRKGGIMVFKASEITIRNSECETFNHQWMSDHALNSGMECGLEPIDEFMVVTQKMAVKSSQPKFCKRFGVFLVFKKI